MYHDSSAAPMLQQLCPRQRKTRFQARIEIRNRRYDVRDRALACAIPMIIQGLDYGNDLNLNYNDFFLPRMVENLDEWINSKKYTMQDITDMIGSKKVS